MARFRYLAAPLIFFGLIIGYSSVRPARANQRTKSQPLEETFTGEVTRNFEIDDDSMDQLYRHMIYDDTRKTNYFLDDRGKAEKYDGKRVEIEGTLNRTNTTIHVDSIKALK